MGVTVRILTGQKISDSALTWLHSCDLRADWRRGLAVSGIDTCLKRFLSAVRSACNRASAAPLTSLVSSKGFSHGCPMERR